MSAVLALMVAMLTASGETLPPEPERTAQALADAAMAYDLPPELLARVAYYESRYRTDRIGDDGRSWGLLQVGPRGRRVCRAVCGTMTTVEEQAMCGACWLDAGRSWCGSLVGGVTAYACGRCTPTGPRCRAAVERRVER